MSITANNLKVREVINQVVNDPAYREVSEVPLLSFHQVGLILLAYLGVFGGMALHVYAGLTLWIVYPIMVFAFYAAFTPLHDATHRAVSSNDFLNDLLGTISASILFPFATTAVYRFLHMAHHRYVGDEDLDPDESLVTIPTKYYPFGYLVLIFPDVLWVYWLFAKAWDRTPTHTRRATLFMFSGLFLFNLAWFLSPYAYEYLILFFIPNRLGMTYIAYSFAHIQHPEGMVWNEQPFLSTFKLKGNKHYLKTFFGQADHAMHHFLPHVPWYKYARVWELANGAFRQQGIPERHVLWRSDNNFEALKSAQQASELGDTIRARVVAVKTVANGVRHFSLQATSQPLPAFSAGAHIGVHLPSGKVRQYSLINPPYETDTYQIAVKLDERGRGGSREMHERLAEGTVVDITPPRNNFLLYENAQRYILISGGIGITPLLSMSHRLTELEQHFELHVCARSAADIPFRYELENWSFAPNVEFHLDEGGKPSIDLAKVLARPQKGTLLYLCGPAKFNDFIRQEALEIGWQEANIKEEVFSNPQPAGTESKAFELHLQRSGKTIAVKADETIIDALHHEQIEVPYSCMQGTCGSCVTNVVSGEIDHRDAVLSEREKASGKKICLCVSRAQGDQLSIDL